MTINQKIVKKLVTIKGFAMKKLILPILLGLTFSTSFAACVKPTKKEIILLAASAYGQLYDKMNELTSKYCYEFRTDDESMNGPLLLNTSAKGLALLQSKTGKSYANISVDHNKMDLFSVTLIDDVMMSERVKKETPDAARKVIAQTYAGVDVSKMNDTLKYNSRKDLLDLLAKEYSQVSVPNQDKMKNTALTYVIATNHPEYIDAALGGLREKEMFMKLNGMGITPLHVAFSNPLKGKNTDELSKKLLATVPVSYMINNVIWNYDYFQFAEAFKENNPTFYKMLKDKYKFEVTRPMDPKIKSEIQKSLNIYWEVDDS